MMSVQRALGTMLLTAIIGGFGYAGYRVITDDSPISGKTAVEKTEVNNVSSDFKRGQTPFTTPKTLDAVVNSNNTTPVPDTAKVAKTPQAKKPAPVLYEGVEVNPLKKFANAKLVGVDHDDIEFYFADAMVTYSARGLLFELDSNKLVNVLGPNYSFYVGQRYNIAYHTFKKDLPISGEDVLRMLLNSGQKYNPILKTNYAERYDGVLVDAELNRRK